MGNPIQTALVDAFAALAADGGVNFTPPTGSAFSAWPINELQDVPGRFLQSPDQSHWFETIQAPVFKAGQVLVGADGKKYTVKQRNETDPFTGAFQFSVLPGRP